MGDVTLAVHFSETVNGFKISRTHNMQRMEAACCIFILFFRLRMLSEDWYTWMLAQIPEIDSSVAVWRGILGEFGFSESLPSVLGAQPHRALIGLRVDTQKVLQTGPGEGSPRGSSHGPAVHGALGESPASSSNAQHSRGAVRARYWELLLLLTAGGLCSHVFGARAFIIFRRWNRFLRNGKNGHKD